MAVLTITLQGACGGGGHLALGVALDAGPVRIVRLTAAEVRNALDDEGKDQLIAGLLRLYSVGKTKSQVRTGLQAGLAVTI